MSPWSVSLAGLSREITGERKKGSARVPGQFVCLRMSWPSPCIWQVLVEIEGMMGPRGLSAVAYSVVDTTHSL